MVAAGDLYLVGDPPENLIGQGPNRPGNGPTNDEARARFHVAVDRNLTHKAGSGFG
jgi:hypothetical protein